MVTNEGGVSWLPYPESASTNHFRHIWLMQRRTRVPAPVFVGSPIPHRRAGETDSAAMITVTYFHPWTLRIQDAEEHFVPHASNLQAQDVTWEDTMSTWLNGNVISQESARCVNHFLCVFRVRPRNPDEDERSDEDIDDEELILTKENMKEALKTRIGGHHTQGQTPNLTDSSKTSHEANSGQAIDIAQRTWHVSDDCARPESKSPFIGMSLIHI